MTKRTTRKSLALVAAGLLASSFAVQTVADAQTVTSPSITLSAVSAGGTVPTGVTGVNVTVTCTSLLGAIATSTATYTVTFGAAGVPTFWPLTPAITGNTGSVCTYGAQLVGSANLTTGTIAMRIGETARTVTNSTSVGTSLIATSKATLTVTAAQLNNTVISADATRSAAALYPGDVGVLPTPISTNVVVTVTFPGLTIRKVVNGDEPVAGFLYPMTTACSNTAAGVAFIELTSGGTPGVAQGSLVVAGAGTSIVVSGVRYFDVRSTGVVAPDVLGTAANMTAAGAVVVPGVAPAPGTLTPSAFVTALSVATSTVSLAPTGTVSGVVVYNGTFTLAGGATRVIGVNEYPGLRGSSVCEVTETNNQGGVTAYSSTVLNADGTVGTPLPGVQITGGVFKSALTAQGQTITVTNSYLGNLVISKVVTGDPKTNIATYEISVACDKGGPKDTFLLKDRQSKVYSNLVSGTNCLITETRSDGAVASYSDNSGDNTTDGRVTIKRGGGTATGISAGTSPSCGNAPTIGAPTVALPGGPTIPVPVVTFDNCDASVIITNNYNVVETTTTTAAPAATTTAAPVTTAAPAVTPAPATPVEATPTFTG